MKYRPSERLEIIRKLKSMGYKGLYSEAIDNLETQKFALGGTIDAPTDIKKEEKEKAAKAAPKAHIYTKTPFQKKIDIAAQSHNLSDNQLKGLYILNGVESKSGTATEDAHYSRNGIYKNFGGASRSDTSLSEFAKSKGWYKNGKIVGESTTWKDPETGITYTVSKKLDDWIKSHVSAKGRDSDGKKLDSKEKLKRQKELFNTVYSDKYGRHLDNDNPDDGWNYRGRGGVQLTGRSNYEKVTKILNKNGINIDLVKNPELAADPRYSADILVAYASMKGMFNPKSRRYLSEEDYEKISRGDAKAIDKLHDVTNPKANDTRMIQEAKKVYGFGEAYNTKSSKKKKKTPTVPYEKIKDLVAARKKVEKGSDEWKKIQNKINEVYGVDKRYEISDTKDKKVEGEPQYTELDEVVIEAKAPKPLDLSVKPKPLDVNLDPEIQQPPSLSNRDTRKFNKQMPLINKGADTISKVLNRSNHHSNIEKNPKEYSRYSKTPDIKSALNQNNLIQKYHTGGTIPHSHPHPETAIAESTGIQTSNIIDVNQKRKELEELKATQARNKAIAEKAREEGLIDDPKEELYKEWDALEKKRIDGGSWTAFDKFEKFTPEDQERMWEIENSLPTLNRETGTPTKQQIKELPGNVKMLGEVADQIEKDRKAAVEESNLRRDRLDNVVTPQEDIVIDPSTGKPMTEEEKKKMRDEMAELYTVPSGMTPSEIGHMTLDMAGMIPVVGEIADGINALWYSKEGNYADAALSYAAMIPFLGWASTGAKWANRARKLRRGEEIVDYMQYIDGTHAQQIRNLKKVQDAGFAGYDATEYYDEISGIGESEEDYYLAKGGPLNLSPEGGPKAEEINNDNNADGMMKARLAYEEMHGNPAAKRMVSPTDNPYIFPSGERGTHYMGSYGNYAVPNIQDVNGRLEMTGPIANEEMRFETEEDARYFAEHYKNIAPAFQKAHGGVIKTKAPQRYVGKAYQDRKHHTGFMEGDLNMYMAYGGPLSGSNSGGPKRKNSSIGKKATDYFMSNAYFNALKDNVPYKSDMGELINLRLPQPEKNNPIRFNPYISGSEQGLNVGGNVSMDLGKNINVNLSSEIEENEPKYNFGVKYRIPYKRK